MQSSCIVALLLGQPFPGTLKPTEFCLGYAVEPLGDAGNEADYLQLMCAVKE